MQFVHAEAAEGVAAFVRRLCHELSSQPHVLWLISGGSNIPRTIQIMRQIPDWLSERLTIMPVDERYGPVGHPGSNVKQLFDAGFEPKHAQFISVLTGARPEETVSRYASAIEQALTQHELIIAQLGMGADGHIEGVLPHSPAIFSHRLVSFYNAPDYLRITLTLDVLRQIAVAYLFAYGAEKREALERLRDQNLSLDIEPAQILKALPEAYVYNDQLKEREA